MPETQALVAESGSPADHCWPFHTVGGDSVPRKERFSHRHVPEVL
jgi:hypothetical protein